MPTLGTVKGDLGYQDYDFLQLGVGFESNLMGNWDLKTILTGWENKICTPSYLSVLLLRLLTAHNLNTVTWTTLPGN